MDLAPRVLEGRVVRLEPLSEDHFDGLWAVARDEALWQFTVNRVHARADFERYMTAALAERAEGVSVPFATVDRATGAAIGSTRFGNIAPRHRRVEIGWTWLGRPWQRTGANTEAKYLMLRHAFEHWACVRVELKTSALNARSRTAILRLGAREEGVLRRHMMNDDGSFRDSVYFSILDGEWPDVKRRLEQLLSAPR